MRQIFFFVLLAPYMALAGGYGDDVHQTTNVKLDTNQNVTGTSSALASSDNTQTFNTEGDRHDSFALGLSNNMGDVDINDCLASTQWSTPVYGRQTVKLNPWCAADKYDAMGLHNMAARMRCRIRDIREEFTVGKTFNKNACIAANTINPTIVETPDYNGQIAYLARLFAANSDELSQLRAEQAETQKRARDAHRRAQEEEESDRQFAQEALEQLKALQP